MLPLASPSNPNPRPSSSHRSFTTPARLSDLPRRASTSAVGSSENIETLFTHASANIISFSAQGSALEGAAIRSPKSPIGENSELGTLPWTSPTELLVATGPLRIYRVPGSVSFLNSGKFLHAILPKAPCWCVDGESKFALRIPRPNSYYRIELPFESDEDKEQIAELKKVLDNILRYEKLPCPFQRDFEVELPKTPATPIRRSTFQTDSKVKRWRLNSVWEPEDVQRQNENDVRVGTSNASSKGEDESKVEDNLSPLAKPFTLPKVRSESKSTTDPKPLKSAGDPSVTRPRSNSVALLRQRFLSEPFVPKSAAVSSPRQPPPSAPKISRTESDGSSISSGAESFYSLDAPSLRSSSPSIEDVGNRSGEFDHTRNDDEIRFRGRHKRQISELTIRPGPDSQPELLRTPTNTYQRGRVHSPPSTPPSLSDSEDTVEPPHLDVATPPDTIRLRKLTGASQRRAFSPMPHPADMFLRTPSRQRLGTASLIVQKTMEILMGPPANLVALMLHIAAKISFRLRSFASQSASGVEVLPGTWESGAEEDDWGEDDYGIPLRNVGSRSSSRLRTVSEYSDDSAID